MTTAEKKEKLLKKIQQVEDSDLLEHLLLLIEAEIEQKKREPYQLTEMEKEAIMLAETDIEKSDVWSEQEANKKTEKWLPG